MKRNFSNEFTWPIQDPEVKQALDRAYNDGDWGRYAGSNCANLQKELGDYFSVEQVRLCSSGTIAVEIALRAAGVSSGDEVLLAAYDFPGNFRCIESVGATPVLVDVDSNTWSMSTNDLESAFTDKTKACIVSHLHGGIAPIKRIVDIAHRTGAVVIEDICQCPGAMVDCDTDWHDNLPAQPTTPETVRQGKKLGTIGDIATLSFGGSKLLTAGRGGAVITNNSTFHQRATIFCDRGNDTFPLSELQAAVLIPQLKKLDKKNRQRLDASRALLDTLSQVNAANSIKSKSIKVDRHHAPAFYKIPIAIQSDDPSRKQTIIDLLQSQNIKIDHGFRGFTKRSKRRCRLHGDCQHATTLAAQTMVLHHPCLLSDNFPEIVDTIAEVLTTSLDNI
jgi:dTDP-4-amino-4,6-dideoxygalactose transaminase